MALRDQIREHLFGTLIPMPAEAWPDDEADLYAAGLDSLRLMQLLVFIEDKVGVNLPDHELTPERTASVRAIVQWIEEHQRRR
jgi:acyl carrier protein